MDKRKERGYANVSLRQCDNGTEFKGAVLELCARHGIEVRNSSSYHPQTNGSVEAANKIFKRQLRSLQTEFGTGVDDWVRFLPDLAIAINCAKPKRFPASFTPYNVFFGRSPHWLTPSMEADREVMGSIDSPAASPSPDNSFCSSSAPSIDSRASANTSLSPTASQTASPMRSPSLTPSKASSAAPHPSSPHNKASPGSADVRESDTDHFFDIDDIMPMEDETSRETEEDSLELTASEHTLAAHKKVYQDKMRAAVATAATVFTIGQVVSVRVPKQMLLPGEPRRIIAVVSGFNQGGYQVSTKYGIIQKRFPNGALNRVSKAQEEAHKNRIPTIPMTNGKVLKITLTKALQAIYRRSSIQAAQKGGRKGAKRAHPAPSSSLSPSPIHPPPPPSTQRATRRKTALSTASRVLKRPRWEYSLVSDSFDGEFKPETFQNRTRLQHRAATEPR